MSCELRALSFDGRGDEPRPNIKFMSVRRQPVSDRVNSLLVEEVSNICPICGQFEKTGKKFTNHHINHDPGISEYWNLIKICQSCHNDFEKNKNDGGRDRRIHLVKRRLFRDYFGPIAVNAMKVAKQEGTVTAMPYTVHDLCQRNFMSSEQQNVFSVGPSTLSSAFDVFVLTNEGDDILREIFGVR